MLVKHHDSNRVINNLCTANFVSNFNQFMPCILFELYNYYGKQFGMSVHCEYILLMKIHTFKYTFQTIQKTVLAHIDLHLGINHHTYSKCK